VPDSFLTCPFRKLLIRVREMNIVVKYLIVFTGIEAKVANKFKVKQMLMGIVIMFM
jgi:hypothetical protein